MFRFWTCTSFRISWAGILFCNPCNLLDALLPDCSENVSGMSARFACTTSHNTFSHPTSFRSKPCRIANRIASTRIETNSVASNSCSDTQEGASSYDEDELYEEHGSVNVCPCTTSATTSEPARSRAINTDNTSIAATSHKNQLAPYRNYNGSEANEEALRLQAILVDQR